MRILLAEYRVQGKADLPWGREPKARSEDVADGQQVEIPAVLHMVRTGMGTRGVNGSQEGKTGPSTGGVAQGNPRNGAKV